MFSSKVKSGSAEMRKTFERIRFRVAPHSRRSRREFLGYVTGISRRGLPNWGVVSEKKPENRLVDLFALELFSAQARQQLMNDLRTRAERFYEETTLEEIIEGRRFIESFLEARGLLRQRAFKSDTLT
jgi:hypothetical protein